MCAYYEGKLTDYSNKACTDSIQIKGSNPYIYDIQFKTLQWIGQNGMNTFSLSFSDPVNYNRMNFSN